MFAHYFKASLSPFPICPRHDGGRVGCSKDVASVAPVTRRPIPVNLRHQSQPLLDLQCIHALARRVIYDDPECDATVDYYDPMRRYRAGQ